MSNKIGFDIGFDIHNLSVLKNASKSFGTLGRNVKQVTSTFSGLQKRMTVINNLFNNMTRDGNRTDKVLRKVNGSTKLLSHTVSVAKFYLIARVMSTSIKATMDMIETNNLFVVSLGQASEEAQKYVNTLHDLTGLDTTNLKNSIGTFALLSRSMGFNSKNAEILSTNMASLALDLSSLTNVSINQVMKDLRSGLVGQSETVYKYGLDVTEASLKQEAMAQGITKSVRNMGQGEKMALRYAVMIKKSSLSHGDFAKTIEQPANQLRLLQDRFVTLARSIGSVFIPALTVVLPYMNALADVAILLADALASVFGYEEFESPLDAKEFNKDGKESIDVIDGIGKAIKGLQVGGLDELNLLTKPSESTTSGVNIGDPNSTDMEGYESLMESIETKSSRIFKSMKESLGIMTAYVTEVSQPLSDALSRLSESVDMDFTSLKENVIEPLKEWLVDYGIPDFFKLLAGSLDLLRGALELGKENFMWLVNIMLPILRGDGDDGGETIIGRFANDLSRLGKILDPTNTEFGKMGKAIRFVIGTVVKILIVLAILTPVFKILTVIVKVIITVFKIVKLVFLALTSPIGLIVLAIMAVVAIGILLIKHWDTIKLNAIILFEYIGRIISDVVEAMETTVLNIYHSIADTLSNLWKKFKDFVKQVGEAMEAVKVALFTILINAFETSKENILNAIDNIRQGIVRFKNTAIELFEKLKTGMGDVFTAIGNVVIVSINAIISGFEKMLNFLVSGLNSFATSVNSIISKFNDVSDAVHLPSIDARMGIVADVKFGRIPKLARGGLLDDGDLFRAGEFGKSELVGNYNNKTTVMPLENSGFIEAMYDAVFNAVTSASNSDDGNINVVISETAIGNSAIKHINKMSRVYGKGVITV